MAWQQFRAWRSAARQDAAEELNVMSSVGTFSVKSVLRRAPVLRLSLVVAGVIAALALIDVFLEKTEHNELATLAFQADQNGQQLLKRGQAPEAVDAFRKAHALERENTKYELHLIEGLMAAGKTSEADPLMTEILEEQSNNGEGNLVAARLAAKEGHVNSAAAYYHRAIYGEWPSDVIRHQIEVRLELINFLIAHRKQNEILAELLPLQEQATGDSSLQARLANLFLLAGSAARSLEIYRRLIKLDPENGTNYAGLGEAELALGDFHAAHAAFWNAAARDKNNTEWRARLDLSKILSSLDPTLRGLSIEEKYLRSLHILQTATSDLDQCISNHAQLATADATQLVTEAQTKLAMPVPKQPANEMAEDNLSLAERIWRARTSLCGTAIAPDEEPLRLIMEKLAK